MHILQDEDISLLFKSLVVLPQDKTTSENTDTEPPQTEKTSDSAMKKETKEPQNTTSTTAEKQDTEKNSKAEEPKPAYTKVEPFAILTAPHLKASYEAADSPFLKILNALGIPEAISNLSTDNKLLENANNYKCLWCIGLDIQTEKKALSLNHENLLTSPDVLSLKTNEEKKAMYAPLKEFISSNMELISKK